MIYQIYYKEEQKSSIIRGFTPHFNSRCSVYFENQVIVDKVRELHWLHKDDYFGVLPWNLCDKIQRMRSMPLPFTNTGVGFIGQSFDCTKMNRLDFERLTGSMMNGVYVILLMEHIPHNPIWAAEKIHKGFTDFWNEIVYSKLGMPKPTVQNWEKIIYCNFFIAKYRIYKRYVDEMLAPAMEIMDIMPELMQNANYPKRMSAELSEQLGMNYYPFHPFLCERMFSYWYNFIYNGKGKV